MPFNRVLIVFFIFLMLFLFKPAYAALEKCQQGFSSAGGWEEYRKDEFIIQYKLNGRHALPSPSFDKSSTPLRVLDVATQLLAMRNTLRSLGYQDPLSSPRYREQGATHILVRIRHLERSSGLAFDEVRRLPSGECVLLLYIRNNLDVTNLTPAHEYFHLVQYGYTPFKRGWFLEGMARWAETILGRREFGISEVPSTPEGLSRFFAQSYGAVRVWNQLIQHCTKEDASVLFPEELFLLRYSNGRRVLENDMVLGAMFMRQVLEALFELDEQISLRDGLQRYYWPERVQRSQHYDHEIWSAVMQVCRP